MNTVPTEDGVYVTSDYDERVEEHRPLFYYVRSDGEWYSLLVRGAMWGAPIRLEPVETDSLLRMAESYGIVPVTPPLVNEWGLSV